MCTSKTKQMTLAYWKGLSRDSKRRALTYVFPIHPATIDMLLNEKPNLKQSPWWKLVWQKVRIPEDHTHYKTVIDKHIYIC